MKSPDFASKILLCEAADEGDNSQAGGKNVIFDETLSFLVDKQLMDGTLKVQVQVYDKDTQNDDLLGECEVNLLEHADSKVVSARIPATRSAVGCA